jgi:peptide/nickel transport system permease protein
MIAYAVRRLLAGVIVFLSATALTFWLFLARGGEAIARNLTSPDATQDQVRETAEALGLLRPIPIQYIEWLGSVFNGTLGQSLQSGQPVSTILASRIPVTMSLVVVSLVLTLLLAVPLGVAAATRGGAIDRALQLLAVIVQAIPGYWMALILVIIFGLTLRWFPATGYIPFTVSVWGWLSTIFLPSLAIALGVVAFVGTQIRGSMLDVLRQEYIRTLRSRGIPLRSIVFRHALRNAAPPTLTILSLQIIALLGGAIIVERIYALPGLGTIAITSGLRGDFPVVLGTVAFMVGVIVVINFATDILIGITSPKARVLA